MFVWVKRQYAISICGGLYRLSRIQILRIWIARGWAWPHLKNRERKIAISVLKSGQDHSQTLRQYNGVKAAFKGSKILFLKKTYRGKQTMDHSLEKTRHAACGCLCWREQFFFLRPISDFGRFRILLIPKSSSCSYNKEIYEVNSLPRGMKVRSTTTDFITFIMK